MPKNCEWIRVQKPLKNQYADGHSGGVYRWVIGEQNL